MKIERRFGDLQQIEVRANEDGSATVTGYPAVFNSLSLDLGGFKERIAPGAFSRTIEEQDVRALFNHDSNFILGRTSAQTLRLAEDDHGLRMDLDLPDTQIARDLAVSMRRGDITGGSFGFNLHTDGDSWQESDDEGAIRTLNSVRLFDVGPVVYPAYPDTDVSVAHRSMERWYETIDPGANEIRGRYLDLLSI
jgi:HK97 family phage prohead protease